MANVEVDQFANRIPDLDIYTTDEFQHALFGQSAFQRALFRGEWITFQRLDGWKEPTCFHGLCLAQLHTLLREGVWQCARWKESTKTSPSAVWVTGTRSTAIDRASASRGYAAECQLPPNAWDCPVALGLAIPSHRIGLHKILANGVRISRIIPADGNPFIPIEELEIVEVNVYLPMFRRFERLGSVWEQLKRDEQVLCRCRRGEPNDFFKGGKGAPWSCGRTTHDPEAHGWLTTVKTGTGQWRCPQCSYNKEHLLGAVTGER